MPRQPDRPRIGERVLLLNHVSHDVANPYRASHAIFVTEGAERSREYVDQVPPVFQTRVLSLRGFDAHGMMADAVLAQPGEAEAAIRKLFDNPAIGPSTPIMPRAVASGQDRKELTMASLAPVHRRVDRQPWTILSRLDAETAWAAFMRRDRAGTAA